MFKRGFFSGAITETTEGFSVRVGRDWLVYTGGERRMHVTVDFAGICVVFLSTVGRWDDEPDRSVGDEEQRRIASGIKRALESQGIAVEFMVKGDWLVVPNCGSLAPLGMTTRYCFRQTERQPRAHATA